MRFPPRVVTCTVCRGRGCTKQPQADPSRLPPSAIQSELSSPSCTRTLSESPGAETIYIPFISCALKDPQVPQTKHIPNWACHHASRPAVPPGFSCSGNGTPSSWSWREKPGNILECPPSIQSVPKPPSLAVQHLLIPWMLATASRLLAFISSPPFSHLHAHTATICLSSALTPNPALPYLMIELGLAWFPSSGTKSQKGVLEVSFCSLEEFDGIQQVHNECLLSVRSHAGHWAPRGISGLGRPWRSPSVVGPTHAQLSFKSGRPTAKSRHPQWLVGTQSRRGEFSLKMGLGRAPWRRWPWNWALKDE